MDSNYDLTTQGGLKKAIAFFSFSTLGWLLSKTIGGDSQPTISQQTKAAKDLITEGKKSGVKSLSIRMDKNAALNLGGVYNGVPINLGGSSGTSMTVNVRY